MMAVAGRLEHRLAPGFGNKLARALWMSVYYVLYWPSPRPFHAWRRFLLRLFGAKVGKGALPYRRAMIWAPWNLAMGERSVLGDGVDCYCVAPIEIGDGAVVSQRAFLCTASHDFDDPGFALVAAPIQVRAQAWVCAEAFVGPGVEIGEGAVVAARAVVTRDLEPWSVVGGNPAKVLRKRAAHKS